MDKVLGVGIIGCGNISATYLELIPMFRNIAVVAVADISMAAAQARANAFDVPAQTVKDLLANPEVSIVLNLTVPAVHYKVTKQALLAGKHVYSEKPLTLTMAEAKDLQAIAKRRKLQVAAAPDTFLGGSHQMIRKLIDDGAIGKVASGTAHILSQGMEHWHPNPHFFFKPGGGPILDMGPYYIANLVNLVGPVKRVAALAATPRKERMISSAPRKGQMIKVTTPTTYHALLNFANGAAITLSASWDVYAHRHQHIEIYGTEGAVFVPDPNFFGGEVMLAGTGSDAKPVALWDHPFTLPNWKDHGGTAWPNYRAAGLADMAVGILKKRDIRCGISRIAHVVEIMTAIAASAKSGRFVSLKTTCTRPKALPPEEARSLLKTA
jgi:predicted dehydrogenase